MVQETKTFLLDGSALTCDDLVLMTSGGAQLDLTPEAWTNVAEARKVVDNILTEKKVAYGINTGFGLFSDVIIDTSELKALQENLIRSHCAGTGTPLTKPRTRRLLALRINVLAKGHSGIRVLTLERLIVPEKGTVGASGDLSPLSHLALGYMGEELMTSPMYPYPTSAATVLAHHFLVPIELHAKEGLALINGTQLIGSLAAETIVRSKNLLQCADVAVAFSLEVLKGTVNAFHPQIHQVRPHAGQNLVAQRVRTLLQYEDKPSE